MRQIVKELRQLLRDWFKINRKIYEVSSGYWTIISEDIVIIQIPWLGSKGKKTPYTDRIFNSILKQIEPNETIETITYELGWQNSLEWLFNHYPYWKDDNSNSICVNWTWHIIWIQYNGAKTTTIIKSLGCPITKEFIVVNKEIKLKGKYKIKDINNLLELIEEYFSINN